jgi:crotonobetainyl-CoA:carnitine CoA-transferase CaiB-like acyl-CoA transferase
MAGDGPLAGVRVLDFGRFIAGPYCGMLFADMGADVIRIDRRDGSEDRYIAPLTADGHGAHFLSINRNKRSLTLDPSKPGASEIVARLVKTADVVIANLPLPVLRKMRLDYESLRSLKPDIILAQISTFGPDGPYASRPGFDVVAQAMSGAMSVTGFPGAPIRETVPFEDYGTALHAAFGVMVALHHRTRTGRGQVVEGSLLATAVTFMQPLLAERTILKRQRSQIGNAGFYSAPADSYQAKDGWIVVQTIGDSMFHRWARLMGREDLIDEPDFADDATRQCSREVITDIMNRWIATRSCAEALAALEQARIPAGPVLGLDDVLVDPQVTARELLRPIDFPGAESVPIANTPVRLSETPGSIRHRAPLPGEHTDEILRELGFSSDAVQRFRATDVV